MFDFILTFPPQPISPRYDVQDHYWFIARDRTRAFSSKRGVFVPIDDVEFQTWLSMGTHVVTTIENVAALMGVMWRANAETPDLVTRCKTALGNPPCRRRFKARELIQELTPTDYAAITTAAASDPQIGLIWTRLLAQGEAPVDTKRPVVRQGITMLVSTLGNQRAQEIVAALGLVLNEGQRADA